MHETYMDPSVVRNVRLYMTGTKAIWIDVNDVPWLIDFVKAEYECQEGCEAPADSTSPALADHGGGIGIEGCSIIWNFEKSQYEAKIALMDSRSLCTCPVWSTLPHESRRESTGLHSLARCTRRLFDLALWVK